MAAAVAGLTGSSLHLKPPAIACCRERTYTLSFFCPIAYFPSSAYHLGTFLLRAQALFDDILGTQACFSSSPHCISCPGFIQKTGTFTSPIHAYTSCNCVSLEGLPTEKQFWFACLLFSDARETLESLFTASASLQTNYHTFCVT